MKSRWVNWAQRLAALAQNGLLYAKDSYDRERYESIRGVAAEILSESTGRAASSINELLVGEIGYATPKVDVRGVAFCKNKILLVKEIVDGKWSLPGGWADVGETPAEAVKREVHEESGFETKVKKLLAVFDNRRHGHPVHATHIYKLLFQCELTGGEASSSVETEGASFFALDNLPELSLGRTTPIEILRCFSHLRTPDLPTDFD